MGWTDRVTAAIAGKGTKTLGTHFPVLPLTKGNVPGLTDQLDKARLEKQYEGAEERLRETKNIACEPRMEISKRELSVTRKLPF